MHRLLWGKVSLMLFYFLFYFFLSLFCFHVKIISPQADVQFLMSWCEAYSRCFGSVRTWSESSFS